jgi:hypothetical protein
MIILFVTVHTNGMWAKVGGTLQNIKSACSLQIFGINMYITVAYIFIKYALPYVLTYLFFIKV